GNGGKGVVILSYVTADFGTCTATGSYSQSTDGANTVFTFTGNGTWTMVAAAGTVYYQTLTEVLSLTDSFIRFPAKVFKETLTLTDVISKLAKKTLSD